MDYGELNKKTLTHSGSIPSMESTLEKIASCRYKTKMDKRSGFWQVNLTPNAQELLAFIPPPGRVFKSKVMPFGVANAPALFQELMIGMQIRSEFNLNSPNSLRIRSQSEFTANSA